MCDFACDLYVPSVDVQGCQSAAREQSRERLDHAIYCNPFNVEIFRLFSHQFGKEFPKR